jgi:DNA-binding NtrC family response regulator
VAVDSEAQSMLLAYDWPGNVRELQNVLERAVVLAEQDVVGPEHLPAELRAAVAVAEPVRTPPPGSIAAFPASTAASAPPIDGSTELVPLADVERRHVLRVLESTGGNRERAARILRISRRTLTRMLQRWELSRPRR